MLEATGQLSDAAALRRECVERSRAAHGLTSPETLDELASLAQLLESPVGLGLSMSSHDVRGLAWPVRLALHGGLALVLMLVFSLHLDLLPAAEMKDPIEYDFMTPGEKFVDRLQHILLPGIALGLASAAGTARYMRSSMLEVIRQDYVRTARAKGLSERSVLYRHVF